MDDFLKKIDDLLMQVSAYRSEGFPGQSHVVLPAPLLQSLREDVLFRGLYVTDAGHFPQAQHHRVSRIHGARSHVLIHCREGNGWLEVDGQRMLIERGGFIFLAANVAHRYGAMEHDPWTIDWVHFSGSEAEAWRKKILGTAYCGKLHPALPLGLAQIHETLIAGYDERRLLSASLALRAALIALSHPQHHFAADHSTIQAVESTAEWIREHLTDRITLSALARRAGLSNSRYSGLFKQRFGFAPIDWVIRQRIQKACFLLDERADKLAAIAYEVGFRDSYYFSRSFRQIMGCSPRAYRAQEKG